MKILAIISTKGDLYTLRPEAEQFIAMHKRGITIDVMCHANSEYADKFRAANMKIVGEFPAHKKDKKAISEIRTLLIKENYDILHALLRVSIACGLKASKGLPVKIVAYRGALGLYWHDPTAYENALNPRIDKVICVCDAIRRQLTKQLFFKKEKAVTIYKGHRPEWYAGVIKADLLALDIPKDALVVTWVANNRKWKDLDSFLKAINLLPVTKNIHILLIGKGVDTPSYQKKIDANCNKEKIHVTGFRKDVLNLVASSHITMQTSFKNEGLSRSTLEAMSMGLVPIVTNTGGNPELVKHNVCGLVVGMKDYRAMAQAIIRLYDNPELRDQFSKAAKERIKSYFTVENTANQTIKVYHDLLSEQFKARKI